MKNHDTRRTCQRGAAIFTVLAAVLVPYPLLAQAVGDRVRFSYAGELVTGRISVVGDERLELQDQAQHTFAFDRIQRLERSTGAQSRWKNGLLIGGGVGILVGSVVGELYGATCEVFIGASDECDEVESGIGIRAMALYGGTLGAIGAGVGYLIKRESWVRVSLSGNDIDISPVAALLSAEEGPRLALGVRVGF